jgi:hypothetical protein
VDVVVVAVEEVVDQGVGADEAVVAVVGDADGACEQTKYELERNIYVQFG